MSPQHLGLSSLFQEYLQSVQGSCLEPHSPKNGKTKSKPPFGRVFWTRPLSSCPRVHPWAFLCDYSDFLVFRGSRCLFSRNRWFSALEQRSSLLLFCFRHSLISTGHKILCPYTVIARSPLCCSKCSVETRLIASLHLNQSKSFFRHFGGATATWQSRKKQNKKSKEIATAPSVRLAMTTRRSLRVKRSNPDKNKNATK